MDPAPPPPPPKEAGSPSPRAAAIATFKRAASTRTAASPSPHTSRTPSPTVSRSPSSSRADRRRSRSIGALSSAYLPPAATTTGYGDDASLFPPPLPHTASSSTLERTASLLARQLAMAKLTGTAPPPAPATLFLATDAPLPTLDELQHRARAKLAGAARRGRPAPGVGEAQAQAQGAGLARSGTVNLAPLPPLPLPGGARPGVLRRSNTVTGVGTATLPLSLAAAQLHLPPPPATPDTAARDGYDPTAAAATDERAAARVNLMRKLSARRLAGPTPTPTPSRRGKPGGALEVVGAIGRARPRSGSVGGMDWREGAREGEELLLLRGDGVAHFAERMRGGAGAGGARDKGDERALPPLVMPQSEEEVPSAGHGHEFEQETPRIAHAGHGEFAPAPPPTLEERTPRPLSSFDSSAGGASDPSGDTPLGAPPRAPSTTSTASTTSTTSLSLRPLSPTRRAAPAPRPGGRASGIPSFGYAASLSSSSASDAGDDGERREGTEEEEDALAREARKRGSSASSSVTGAVEAAARGRWRGSDAVPLPLPRVGEGAGAGRSSSTVGGATGEGDGAAEGEARTIGLGVDEMPPPVPLVPEGLPTPAKGDGAARGDGQAEGRGGEAKDDGGGFPPPEKGYLFPSPVAVRFCFPRPVRAHDHAEAVC